MSRRGHITTLGVILGTVLVAGLPPAVWGQQTPPKDAGGKAEATPGAGQAAGQSPTTAKSGAPAAQGEPETYKIDAVHSSIIFRIKHLNISYVYGRFNDVSGTVVLNETDPATCSITAEVKVESIDTHNADRDKHLKSPEFFDVEKYPTIVFKSASFKKAGEAYEVQGNLTLHGVTKPLTVKLERTGAAADPKGDFRAGFETGFTIKRSDFGMTTAIGPIADDVRLTISLEAIRQ